MFDAKKTGAERLAISTPTPGVQIQETQNSCSNGNSCQANIRVSHSSSNSKLTGSQTYDAEINYKFESDSGDNGVMWGIVIACIVVCLLCLLVLLALCFAKAKKAQAAQKENDYTWGDAM
jgi:hypothetical protein